MATVTNTQWWKVYFSSITYLEGFKNTWPRGTQKTKTHLKKCKPFEWIR